MKELDLQVLKEIKDLMDGRINDRLKPKAVAIEVTSMGKKPEESEMPLELGDENKEEEISPEDLMKLEELCKKYKG